MHDYDHRIYRVQLILLSRILTVRNFNLSHFPQDPPRGPKITAFEIVFANEETASRVV